MRILWMEHELILAETLQAFFGEKGLRCGDQAVRRMGYHLELDA